MSGLTYEQLLVPLPDVEGLVHGIVSVDPPRVQCDGCGLVATGRKLTTTILTCGITFNARLFHHGDERRLCRDCAKSEWGKA